MLRVVVLISGGGSNLRALLEECRDPAFPAHVVAVGADRAADGLAHAEQFGLPSFTVPYSSYASRDEWGDELLAAVQQWQPDLVVLSGLMRLLPPRVVEALAPRLINTHPAYLPEFPGAHGVRDALAAGVAQTGASVIVVDTGVDTGPILAQERVPVLPDDTEHSLHERIKPVERRLLIDVVRGIAEGSLRLGSASTPPTPTPPLATQEFLMAGPAHDPALYRHRDAIPVRRALISVSDKTGLLELAAQLAAAGVEMVSTGSTAATIAAAGHPVTEVSQVTGFAETLDGRVKTLHPAVHAGILADLRLEAHEAQLADLGVSPFDLVIVNLYPFVETVASGAEGDAVVEQIDIGGPAMVRAAAKNHANVAIIVDPSDYVMVTKALTLGGTTLLQRQRFAAKAFAHTAAYDTAVAAWFADTLGVRGAHPAADGSPSTLHVSARLQQVLRYGENSHQHAALYRADGSHGIAQATQLHGKEMSYNNVVDADAAVRAAYDHDAPAVAIIKHANPCGIAVGLSIASAHAAAHACDPVSAFGGVIAANRVITRAAAESIAPIFTEVVVAPGFDDDALAVLREKKNIRLLQLPAGFALPDTELRQVSGGWLRQSADRQFAPASDWQLVSGSPASAEQLADLEFAWRACRAVKSNAILLASGGASVGVGMGQVNRVDSCHLAVSRAGDRARGSVAASDAFFPFADGLQVLIDAGVSAVVQPGGSVRDEEVIAAAQAAGVTMYLTGERHFFH